MTSSTSPTSFYSSQLTSTMTSSYVWTPSATGRQSVDDNGGSGRMRNVDAVMDVAGFSLITPLSAFGALQSVAAVSGGRLREFSNAEVVGSGEKKITRFTIDAILGNGDGDDHVDNPETDQWRLSQSAISRDGDRVESGGSGSKEEVRNERAIGTVEGLDVVQMAAADSADSGLVRGWHSDSTCGGDSVCPECHSTDGVMQRNDVDSRTTSSGVGKQTKRVRTIYTQEQLDRLEREFVKQQYMVGAERYYLAVQLGLVEAQVKVWFQNRRIKWRRQAIEAQRQSLSSSTSSSSTSSRYHRQHGRQQQSQRRPAVSATTYRDCRGADSCTSDLYPSTHMCFRHNTVNHADDFRSASISTFPYRSSSAAFDLDAGVTLHSAARRQTVSGIADSCSEDLDLVTSGFGDVAGDCIAVDMRNSRLDRTFPTINS